MRIVQVDPRGGAFSGVRAQPRDGGLRGLVSPLLNRVEKPCIVSADFEMVAVGVEAGLRDHVDRHRAERGYEQQPDGEQRGPQVGAQAVLKGRAR